MNRWINRVIVIASLSGAMALASGAVAIADPAGASAEADAASGPGHHGHPMGLIDQALKLDSLTSNQRSAIEQLAQAKRAAAQPVRRADAQVLTALAGQIETGAVNTSALALTIQAKETAEKAAGATDQDLTQKLHDLLTPAQRGQVVDAMEASHPGRGRDGGGERFGHGGDLGRLSQHLGLSQEQTQRIAENLKAERDARPHDAATDPEGHGPNGGHHARLESFRGEAFAVGAPTGERFDRRTQHMETIVQAAVPVLTPEQRTQLAAQLRARAAHENRG